MEGYVPVDLAVLGLEPAASVVLGNSCCQHAGNLKFAVVRRSRRTLETCAEIVLGSKAALQVDRGAEL